MEPITPETASPGMVAALTAVATLQGHNDIDQTLASFKEFPALETMVREQAVLIDEAVANDPGIQESAEARMELLERMMPRVNETNAFRLEMRQRKENRRPTVQWNIGLLTYVIRKALFEPNWRDPRFATGL